MPNESHWVKLCAAYPSESRAVEALYLNRGNFPSVEKLQLACLGGYRQRRWRVPTRTSHGTIFDHSLTRDARVHQPPEHGSEKHPFKCLCHGIEVADRHSHA